MIQFLKDLFAGPTVAELEVRLAGLKAQHAEWRLLIEGASDIPGGVSQKITELACRIAETECQIRQRKESP